MEDPAAPGPAGSPANDNGNGNGNGNSNGNGNGGKGKPKGRETFRNQRRESEVRNPEMSASGKRRLRWSGPQPGPFPLRVARFLALACGFPNRREERNRYFPDT